MLRRHSGQHRHRYCSDPLERRVRGRQHRSGHRYRQPIAWSPDGHGHLLRLRADGHPHQLHVSVRPGRKPRGLDRGSRRHVECHFGFLYPGPTPATGASPATTRATPTTHPSSDTSTDECFDVTPANTGTATSPTLSSIAFGAGNTDQATVTGNPLPVVPRRAPSPSMLRADGHPHQLHVSVQPGRKPRGLDRGSRRHVECDLCFLHSHRGRILVLRRLLLGRLQLQRRALTRAPTSASTSHRPTPAPRPCLRPPRAFIRSEQHRRGHRDR